MQTVTVECQRCEVISKEEFDGVIVLGIKPGDQIARYINHELKPGYAIVQILDALNSEEYNEAMSVIGLFLADRRLKKGDF